MSDPFDDFIAQVAKRSRKIERNLGYTLAHHYTKDNFFDDFVVTISPEFTLDKKIKLVKAIIENNYPEHYQKYKKVFTSVDKFRKVRNGLIHGRHNSALYSKDRVVYLQQRNGKISWSSMSIAQTKKFLKNAEEIEKNLWDLDYLVLQNPQCRSPDKIPEKNTNLVLD